MTANAKAETIFEKKLYKSAILNNRCIIALDGFYEWRHVLGKKFPHYIYSKNEPVFYIGGIYNEFINKETSEVKKTVSMITTEANPMMAVIHNMKKRMPFILPTNKIMDWLDPKLTQNEITQLMKSYEESLMAYHTVARKLNPLSEESIQEHRYNELSGEQQSLFD
jgi:putative SOS response-associated peptidase YedK